MTSSMRSLFLDAARAAAGLIADPKVAAAWDEPGALPKMTVGGIAEHLAHQILSVPEVVAVPVEGGRELDIDAYYAQLRWIGEDPDSEINTAIRDNAEQRSAEGPAGLVARTAAALAHLTADLPSVPDHQVRMGHWQEGISLSVDTFLRTRLLELLIHSDDLAASVGLETPAVPAAATESVVDVLTRIAIRRHGPVAVLRGLSRTERAPKAVNAL
ncbi:maleylpyruvate isomerase N-terminal domain-containing protein [Streptomyces sp. NPDC049577]|uniref:maleylpyruvate isomerase N-terminal domain-containing protein n=1 Tax=Streptomyces sp. NPDC049577 TaxID=3155153 RepID=UPI00342C5F7E